MEVQDGFIVGIYNYCDRWCETCAFTSRCRVFADCAEMAAELDTNLKEIAEAPPLPRDIPPPPPLWMQELFEDMNKAASEPLSAEVLEKLERHMAPEHEPIETRALAYGEHVDRWFESRRFDAMYARRYSLSHPLVSALDRHKHSSRNHRSGLRPF